MLATESRAFWKDRADEISRRRPYGREMLVSYKVLLGEASTPSDYNIINMVEYKNMAALDGLRAKTDPIAQKIIGGEDQQREAAMKRAELREILGGKLMREITLK